MKATGLALILKEWFGVPPAAARVAVVLYEADGMIVDKAELMAAAGQTSNGIQHSLKDLRAIMDPGSIDSVWGRGWRMTAAGRADCDRGRADAAAREVAA